MSIGIGTGIWRTRRPIFGGTATPVPLTIANRVIWLDASQIAGSVGTSITTWSDLSGIGTATSPTQATGSQKPVLQSVTANGKTYKVVRFDGVDDNLIGALPALGPGCEFHIVGSYRTGAAFNTGLCSIGQATESDFNGTNSAILWNSGFNGGVPSGADAKFRNDGNNTLTNKIVPIATWYRYSILVDTATHPVLTMATQSGTVATGTSATNVGPSILACSLVLGARWVSGAASSSGLCDIAEVFVTSGPLSTGDRASLYGYWSSKYGT